MKRKIKIIVISLSIITAMNVFVGCIDDSTHCNVETEWITVINRHPDPYEFLIDESFIAIIPSHDTITHYIEVGTYTKIFIAKLIQKSGFDSIPRVYEETLYIDPCFWTTWAPKDY